MTSSSGILNKFFWTGKYHCRLFFVIQPRICRHYRMQWLATEQEKCQFLNERWARFYFWCHLAAPGHNELKRKGILTVVRRHLYIELAPSIYMGPLYEELTNCTQWSPNVVMNSLDNGLLPVRWQTIIWTNADIFSFQASRTIFMQFKSKYKISIHDDAIKRKQFPCHWPFMQGIRRSPVNYPHKDQWRWALVLSLICT